MKQVLFYSLLFLAVACQNAGSNKAAADSDSEEKDGQRVSILKQEVMAAHDRVMPSMGQMRRQQKQLRQMAQTSPDSALYLEVAINLKKADDGMMEWMHNFKAPDEQDWSEEEKAQYLMEQKAKMIEIENLTFQNMYLADSILQSVNPAQPE